jgi:hypothetical protein
MMCDKSEVDFVSVFRLKEGLPVFGAHFINFSPQSRYSFLLPEDLEVGPAFGTLYAFKAIFKKVLP